MAKKKNAGILDFISARLTKEVIILTAFTEVVWVIFWAPLGFIMNLSISQWIAWIGYGIPYDLLFAYITSKIIIKFDVMAKKKGWY